MPHTCAVIVKPLPCMVKCVGADAATGRIAGVGVAVGVGVGVAVGNATGCAVVLGAGFGAEEEHAPRLSASPSRAAPAAMLRRPMLSRIDPRPGGQ